MMRADVDPLAWFLADTIDEDDPFDFRCLIQERRDFNPGKVQINTTSFEGSSKSTLSESSGIKGSILSYSARNECSISPEVGFTVAPSSDSAANPPAAPSSITSSSLTVTVDPLTMNMARTSRVEKNATAMDLPSDLDLSNSSSTSTGKGMSKVDL